MTRVVSLVPSVTETLLAWGVEPVAVTRFCEQPGYPTVGGTKNPDVAAIAALAPDLVVVDREENRAEDAAALAALGVPVLDLHVRSVADVPSEMRRLADACGVAVADIDPGPSARPQPRVRAFVPIWRRPWMSIGTATYGSSVLAAIGVDNVLAGADSPYPTVTLDEVAALDADVVLAPSEPYEFSERHRAELEVVAPVRFVDGKDLFWWGWRTPGALRRLASAGLADPSGQREG